MKYPHPKKRLQELAGIDNVMKESVGSKLFKWWFGLSPKDVARQARELSDKDLMLLKRKNDESPQGGSPRDIQVQVIDREIARRGLK